MNNRQNPSIIGIVSSVAPFISLVIISSMATILCKGLSVIIPISLTISLMDVIYDVGNPSKSSKYIIKLISIVINVVLILKISITYILSFLLQVSGVIYLISQMSKPKSMILISLFVVASAFILIGTSNLSVNRVLVFQTKSQTLSLPIAFSSSERSIETITVGNKYEVRDIEKILSKFSYNIEWLNKELNLTSRTKPMRKWRDLSNCISNVDCKEGERCQILIKDQEPLFVISDFYPDCLVMKAYEDKLDIAYGFLADSRGCGFKFTGCGMGDYYHLITTLYGFKTLYRSADRILVGNIDVRITPVIENNIYLAPEVFEVQYPIRINRTIYNTTIEYEEFDLIEIEPRNYEIVNC
jgi:hypothetical protein